MAVRSSHGSLSVTVNNASISMVSTCMVPWVVSTFIEMAEGGRGTISESEEIHHAPAPRKKETVVTKVPKLELNKVKSSLALKETQTKLTDAEKSNMILLGIPFSDDSPSRQVPPLHRSLVVESSSGSNEKEATKTMVGEGTDVKTAAIGVNRSPSPSPSPSSSYSSSSSVNAAAAAAAAAQTTMRISIFSVRTA